MKKRKTKNQIEWEKQLKRLQRAQKQYEKNGIRFEIPSLITEKPKRITKRYLETIKAIKPKNLIQQRLKPSIREYIRQTERRQKNQIQGITFSAITKQAQAIKKVNADTTYIPTFSYVQAVRKRLLELYETPSFVSAPVRKNELLAIFEDTVTLYSENSDELEKHLKEKQKRISELCSIITYDSDGENVNASFIELAEILNIKPLSDNQREKISEFAELING